MIYQINNKIAYKSIEPLLKFTGTNPVIQGVMEGSNPGRIYVDDLRKPEAALVWAINEMFFLIGEANIPHFNNYLKHLFLNEIKPEAMEIREEMINLETYPHEQWECAVMEIFSKKIGIGQRVPFLFDEAAFRKQPPIEIPDGYKIKTINRDVLLEDKDHVIFREISKFWPSATDFFSQGIGVCSIKDQSVVGTCISAFASRQDHEIGINTSAAHRSKGLGKAMAKEFISICLKRGIIPHWTTEDFRKDSIAIAKRAGFTQLPSYPVYFLPSNELL
ncbi:GNAT family N-acetyltransferase [Peribacillus sp. B-H-3]|uniref:GNAT family N-acetyltransferase n=1 Tax=Peribacillus sp. B-H-3 TaxID=3400420 RepID=UPI003B024FF6